MPSYPALNLGPLPVMQINAVLYTNLPPGNVTVSKIAHRHIAEKHPVEYQTVMASLTHIIASPSFVGQDPAHPHAFYLVQALQLPGNGTHALVAIAFNLTPGGTYPVASAYSLSASQFAGRLRMRRLFPL